MDPTGKVALVTGGASGIGLAICEGLLQQKVKGLVFCDVNADLGEQKHRELEQKYGSGRIFFVKADVRFNDQLEDVFKEAKKTFGQLDIVVNNAGIFDDVNWEKEVDVNLKGIIRGMLLAFKYMGKSSAENNEGIVVNIASIAGFEVFETIPIYCGIKHGIVGLTRAFGTPLHFNRTGVRVVAMCPGFTSTCMGTPEGTLLDESWREIETQPHIIQTPDCVFRGVLHMIQVAENGSLWVSEDEKPAYQVAIPPKLSMKV